MRKQHRRSFVLREELRKNLPKSARPSGGKDANTTTAAMICKAHHDFVEGRSTVHRDDKEDIVYLASVVAPP